MFDLFRAMRYFDNGQSKVKDDYFERVGLVDL